MTLMLSQIFGLREARQHTKVLRLTELPLHLDYNKHIHEPTYIIGDLFSWIDLIFTSRPKLVMKSVVHSSLHRNCHPKITYAKFNLKNYYPPTYEREIWHYEKAYVDHITRSIDEFS